MVFFEFVKNCAFNIWGAVKKTAGAIRETGGKIFENAKKVMDTVKDGYERITKIPVIGNVVKSIVDTGLNLPVPFTGGISVGTGLKTAENVIKTGNKIFNN